MDPSRQFLWPTAPRAEHVTAVTASHKLNETQTLLNEINSLNEDAGQSVRATVTRWPRLIPEEITESERPPNIMLLIISIHLLVDFYHCLSGFTGAPTTPRARAHGGAPGFNRSWDVRSWDVRSWHLARRWRRGTNEMRCEGAGRWHLQSSCCASERRGRYSRTTCSLCLSVPLPPSLCLPLSLSFFLSLSLPLSLSASLNPSVSLSLSPQVCLSLTLCMCV